MNYLELINGPSWQSCGPFTSGLRVKDSAQAFPFPSWPPRSRRRMRRRADLPRFGRGEPSELMCWEPGTRCLLR